MLVALVVNSVGGSPCGYYLCYPIILLLFQSYLLLSLTVHLFTKTFHDMNQVSLVCVKCTATKSGGYRLTLQSEESTTPAVIPGLPEGKPKSGKKYAYSSVTPVAVDTKLVVDFDYIDINTEEWVVDDETSANFGETVKIHWINAKKA